MELTIKLDLTEQTLGMIKGFLQAFEGFKPVATAEPKAEKKQVTAKAVEEPKAPETETAEQEQAAPTTLSDLRQIFTSIAEAGGREKIRELLNTLGVKKITEIAEERYTEVYKALEKIANELPAPF
ncbi:hypothetical protein [Hoylesella nanceiensis]|uniref:hypothetical protein n=1 Tax=Hoylesella nanceiensis TaxID=425941 RepID=UPI0028EB7A0D|nr:hypothetical protein [Hoylesella nanceiensis]